MNRPITVKGQVTIPKAMREHLGLAPGDRVVFSYLEEGALKVTAESPRKPGKAARSAFAVARGRLKGRGRTDELMRLLRGTGEDGKDPGFK